MASIQKLTRKSGTVYRVFIRNQGSQPITKIFKSNKNAKEFIKKVEADSELHFIYGDTRIKSIRLSSLIAEYMTQYEGVSPSTRQSVLDLWLRLIGDKYIVEINKQDIRNGINTMAKQPVKRGDGKGKTKVTTKKRSNGTLNRYKGTVSALFEYAVDEYDLPVNPARQVRAKKESDGRIRFLSDTERSRLLEACKNSNWGKLYLLVLMAITTGARKSELTNLKWADIDFIRQRAYVSKTKNGEPRVCPLTDSVIVELQKIYTDELDELVFGSATKPEQPFMFRKHWLISVSDAQLDNFKFHDLRHTCASYLAQSGASLLEIGDVLGHKQIEMTKRYSHLCVEHKSKLIASVMKNVGN